MIGYSIERHEEQDLMTGHTIFRNNPGIRWYRRILPTSGWGMVSTFSGSGSVFYKEESLKIQAGDILLMRPNYRYQFESDSDWDFIWVHLVPRRHIVEQLNFDEVITGAGLASFSPAEMRRIHRDILEAHELETYRPQGWYLLAILLVESALQRVFNQWSSEYGYGLPEIQRAAKLLASDTTMDIDQIASMCKMSRSAFYQLFNQKMGCSPRQYREFLIMRHAESLLENTNFSILEIAEKLGFGDQYYFSNRFKKFAGVSPSVFRKKRRP